MNIKNRISQLERQANPESLPTARIALIDHDGSVQLSGDDDITFPTESALDAWAEQNGLGEFGIIKVSYARTAGEPPKEL